MGLIGELGFITQVGRTVLRVKDFTWHPGYMELVEAELDEAIRGEVKLRRVKRHYHERSYGYEMSITPDALEVARRAATWLLVYMWRRALFMVQYDGMSAAAQQVAWAALQTSGNSTTPTRDVWGGGGS